MQIFRQIPLKERSLMQKVFRQYPRENAVIELNNLLATSTIQELNSHEVSSIEEKYGIDFQKSFRLNLEEFYAVVLNYFLKDRMLSNEEILDLERLKSVLSLSDKSISKIHEMVGSSVYEKAFEEIVADGRISEEERQFIEKLESELKLPKELSERISNQVRSTYVQNYITQAVEDHRLSPEEEKELNAIAKSLNINLQMNTATSQQLEKLKLYWTLENAELNTYNVDINLQKSEKCYFFAQNVEWYELRSVRTRTNYSGYSASVKVVKGFYLRTGSYTPRSVSSEQLSLIDKGSLYLTNKRIIFTGFKKNSNIRLEKVLSITPYTDGVEIDKETGRNPVLKINTNADIFCIILDRLIKEI
jgi:hypothetical protein